MFVDTAAVLEPRIEIDVGSELFVSDVVVEDFDPRKFMALAPWRSDFLLVLGSGVFAITRMTNRERIEYFLGIKNVDLCLARFRELRAELPMDQCLLLILNIVDFLIVENQAERAVEVCAEFSTDDTWRGIVVFFKERGKLDLVAACVPLESGEWTKQERTEMLKVLTTGPAKQFCAQFEKLAAGTYQADVLLNEVKRASERDPGFLGPLMHLYHSHDDHVSAFLAALSRTPPYSGFFTDIVKYGQFKFIASERASHFGAIVRAYSIKFVDFLLDHIAELDPALVLRQANAEVDNIARAGGDLAQLIIVEQFKLNYLDRLYETGHSLFDREENGTELALMYVKFCSPKTMKFISDHGNFRLMAVRQAAVEQGMFREAAYLFKRGGDAVGGMAVTLERIGHPRAAIDYAKGCYVEAPIRGRRGERKKKPDKEVWDLLIKHSYSHPEYLTSLLTEIPNLDWKPKQVVRFIQGIKDTSIIPNFEELASRTVKEFRRKLTTAKLTQEIVQTDAFGAFKRSFDRYRTGKTVQFD
jgi:hypothetical protein